MTKLGEVILRDTRANQPAAGVEGRIYYVTDESVLERDSGTVWQDVSTGGGAALLVKAHTSADQTVASSTQDIVDFDTVDYDPGSDVTTGASWHYTVPTTGWYAVGCESGLVHPNGADWVVLDTAEIDVFVNGSFEQIIDYTTATITDQGLWLSVNGQSIISVSATDTVDVRYANGSGSTRKLLTPTYISIERVA